jgi:hypothetical protein
MATARAAVVVLGATLMACGDAYAAQTEAGTVVLHVTDYAHVQPTEMALAQEHASRVYANAGVRLVWTDGCAAAANPDGARHLDVVVLSAAMAERYNPPPRTFGQASPVTKRALIFYGRAIVHAIESHSDPALLLGLVLAHEVGHMLLPAPSHASSGVMRADWDGRKIVRIPDFLPPQATTIRALVAGDR